MKAPFSYQNNFLIFRFSLSKKIRNNKFANLKLNSSLTLEAAFVLPIFIFTLSAFLYFFHILSLYEHIQYAITEIANESSSYAYAYNYIMGESKENDDNVYKGEAQGKKQQDINKYNHVETVKVGKFNVSKSDVITDVSKLDIGESNVGKSDTGEDFTNDDEINLDKQFKTIIGSIIGSTYFKLKLSEYLNKDEIDQSAIVNGMNGISTSFSSFMKDDLTIDIVVRYKISIPIPLLNLNKINMMQRVRVRGFTGKDVSKKGTKEDIYSDTVFVTKYGTVYHKDDECSHIKLSITKIFSKELINARNENGGKYKPCNICLKENFSIEGREVYITKSGDSYHIKIDCSGLKRLINQIPLSNVGSRTPCKRCYKEAINEQR